ncbi:MAG: hypothetical protein Q8K59_11345, partial [Nitrosomonas sp.]|nr:hypothetical protein [Nitrosomonas sp.]MDP1951662.1 hypothetical protein [Nitrosomonas sp.]
AATLAGFAKAVVYGVSDTAANLAAAAGAALNEATTLTATDAATVAQAATIHNATNSDVTSVTVVSDTFANIINAVNDAAVTAAVTIIGTGNASITDAQHDALAGKTTGSGSNTLTLTDAASITAIETVEAYVLGNFTNSITLTSSAGQVVTGGTGADTITGGTGADTITGGAGIDVITTGTGADKVSFFATAVAGSVADYDLVSDFTAGTDDVVALDTAFSWFNGTSDGVVVLATGTTMNALHTANNNFTVGTISTNVVTHTFVTFLAGTSTITQLEGTIATALGAASNANFPTTDNILIAIDDGTHTGLVRVVSNGAGAVIGTDELSLIGILQNVPNATTLVAGDFAFV